MSDHVRALRDRVGGDVLPPVLEAVFAGAAAAAFAPATWAPPER